MRDNLRRICRYLPNVKDLPNYLDYLTNDDGLVKK